MPDEDGYGKFASLRASALVRLTGTYFESNRDKTKYPDSSRNGQKKTPNGSLGEKYLVFLHINRDGGCRYPGFCQLKCTEAHHIEHWQTVARRTWIIWSPDASFTIIYCTIVDIAFVEIPSVVWYSPIETIW